MINKYVGACYSNIVALPIEWALTGNLWRKLRRGSGEACCCRTCKQLSVTMAAARIVRCLCSQHVLPAPQKEAVDFVATK
jgi:hypothetical protein